jgi:2-polyprenyl-6-methoxyphenol hydroxylase-like FAD-dependent oxidoreductase
MAVSELGYVGVVRTAEGRGNLAAAVNATALKSATEPATVVRSILSDAGFSVPSFPESDAWRGTLPLTRRSSRLTGHRVVLIGDAAGYTEPFTGEGMGWALRSAVAIVPMVLRQLASWNGSAVAAWESDQQRLLWRDRLVSRTMSKLLRRPVAVQMALGLLSAVPSFARPLMRHVYH